MNELFLIFLPKKEKEWFIFTKKKKKRIFLSKCGKKMMEGVKFSKLGF